MTRATPVLLALLAALTTQTVASAPIPRADATDLKPLLMRAIETGEAHGVLAGSAADYMRRRFATATPIEIDVRALHPLPQPGCSRLEATTRQRDVREGTQRSDKSLTFHLSFCRDGHVPASAGRP